MDYRGLNSLQCLAGRCLGATTVPLKDYLSKWILAILVFERGLCQKPCGLFQNNFGNLFQH